jgi:hypothetical protein
MRKMHLSVAFAGLALFAGCDQNATSVTGNEGDSLIVASRAAAEGAWAPNKFLLGAGWNTSVRTLGE